MFEETDSVYPDLNITHTYTETSQGTPEIVQFCFYVSLKNEF
jgi:hypothetical protein